MKKLLSGILVLIMLLELLPPVLVPVIEAAEAAKPLYTWQYTVGEVCTIGICYLLHAHTEEPVLSEEYCDSVWVNRFDFGEYITDSRILADVERADL